MHLPAILIVSLLLAACAVTSRPPEPDPGSAQLLPWGAIPPDLTDSPALAASREPLLAALKQRIRKDAERDVQGRPVFRILAISGGGSNGAFAAGLLTGLTASSRRPEFDVVTGISTGALIATFAFLGPALDESLRIYTRISDRDIYSPRSLLGWLRNDAVTDTRPLRELVARMIDADLLDRVAKEYLAGRRLFIGTTNLDSNTFTLWDMGAIASSDRPDRLQRYRDVVLASASAPVLFSPVYIPVDTGGARYWQMHADGGMKEGIMTYGVMQEPLKLLQRTGFGPEDVRLEIYGINNGRLEDRGTYQPVSPNVKNIAAASTAALLSNVMDNSLYRLWLKAQLYRMHIYLAWIPNEVDGPASSFEFDNAAMNRLFHYGYELGGSGQPWQYFPPAELTVERLDQLDPDRFLYMLQTTPK